MTAQELDDLLDNLKWRGIALTKKEQEYYRPFELEAAFHEIMTEAANDPRTEALTLAQRNV